MSDLVRPDAAPEERGTLDVRQRAVERIVTLAAQAVPGTVRSDGTLTRLRRADYPRASVTLRGPRAWIELDVAAAWPCAAERLADNVRRQVLTETRELSSLHVERLDVTLHVLPPDVTDDERRVR